VGSVLNPTPPQESRSTDAEAFQQGAFDQAQTSGESAPAANAVAPLPAQEETEDDGAVLLYRSPQEQTAQASEIDSDQITVDEAQAQMAESPASLLPDTAGGSPGSGFGGASASEISKATPTSLAMPPTSQPSLALRAENTLEKQGTPVADGLLQEVGSDPFRDHQAVTTGPGLDPIGLALLAAGVLLLGTAIATTLFRRRRLQA
ncbi:MAG: hypothetical protein K8J31_04460, partial [Anaerolineae bacterium]|nr:hypothetical protein [Anaerolineae bacterium]